MSAATDISSARATDRELAPYRAVSRSAVLSLVMAGLSVPLVVLGVVSMRYQVGDAVPLGIVGAFFAGLALLLGVTAVRTIRRYPTEYTGIRMATSGLVGGVLLVITGIVISTYTYTTEVPPDHVRTGFWELQPDREDPDQIGRAHV